MRILLLTHSYNSLAQRLHAELARRGHDVSVELDIADAVTAEAVAAHAPGCRPRHHRLSRRRRDAPA